MQCTLSAFHSQSLNFGIAGLLQTVHNSELTCMTTQNIFLTSKFRLKNLNLDLNLNLDREFKIKLRLLTSPQ